MKETGADHPAVIHQMAGEKDTVTWVTEKDADGQHLTLKTMLHFPTETESDLYTVRSMATAGAQTDGRLETLHRLTSEASTQILRRSSLQR